MERDDGEGSWSPYRHMAREMEIVVCIGRWRGRWRERGLGRWVGIGVGS